MRRWPGWASAPYRLDFFFAGLFSPAMLTMSSSMSPVCGDREGAVLGVDVCVPVEVASGELGSPPPTPQPAPALAGLMPVEGAVSQLRERRAGGGGGGGAWEEGRGQRS